jgi:hypothetical protein
MHDSREDHPHNRMRASMISEKRQTEVKKSDKNHQFKREKGRIPGTEKSI